MPKQGVVERAVSSESYVGHPNSHSREEDGEVSQPSTHKVIWFPLMSQQYKGLPEGKHFLFKTLRIILKIAQEQIPKDGVGFLILAALAEMAINSGQVCGKSLLSLLFSVEASRSAYGSCWFETLCCFSTLGKEKGCFLGPRFLSL